MIWVPPPHWMIAILVAFIAQLVALAGKRVVYGFRGEIQGKL